MYKFILIVQLASSEPPVVIPVTSCDSAALWMDHALAWAQRSGIRPEDGPKWTCRPAELLMLRTQH